MSHSVLEKLGRNLSIMSNRNYMLLFLGGLVSRLGSNIHYVALSWYVLEKSGSGLALGMIMMIATLPGVLLAPFAGVWVDRLNRKGLIVWMDLARGVLVLGMAQLLMLDQLSYSVLLLGTLLISVCSTLFNPAISASIPNLVEDQDLSKANSMENLSMNLTGVIGMAIGGVLVGLYGVAGAFMINGVSYILSGISEIFIQLPATARHQAGEVNQAAEEISATAGHDDDCGDEGQVNVRGKSSFYTEMWDGVKFIFTNPLLSAICASSIVMNFFFIGALGVGLPYIVKEVMQLDEIYFGMMESFFPIGAVIGSLVIIVLPEMKKFYRITVVGIALHGVIMMLVGLAVVPWMFSYFSVLTVYKLVAGLLVLMGILNAIINVPMSTFFQRVVPDELRGRFYSLMGIFSQGLIPLAYVVSGFLLGILPPFVLIVIGGAAVSLVSIQLTRIEEFKQL